MGRDLGYFASEELDRPELNKCPDCECYFATEECPLCGKLCPEEMRAGNRAAVKKPKKQKNSSGRVQFIPWYHTWWFIILMFYVMPVAGIILFFTSSHSKKSKIIAASIVVGAYVLLGVVTLLSTGLWELFFPKSPVNDDISRAEYVQLCESMTPEEFFRNAGQEGKYVTMDLEVTYINASDGMTAYECYGIGGDSVVVCVVDYSLDSNKVYMAGDMIRVYGECAGLITFDDKSTAPVLYMAYSELIG